MPRKLPPRRELVIGFAHAAYQMSQQFERRGTGIRHFEVRSFDELKARAREADVLCLSMLWRNELLEHVPKLVYIQSISAGTDQFDKAKIAANGIRLANATGVNARAVAQHAMGLMLALARHIHTGRDHQTQKLWRGMISDIGQREDELTGKTLLIVGMGRIGSYLARLAKAFEMTVIATKRDPSTGADGADEVYGTDRLPELLGRADIVALTCPLTPQTENLIDRAALARMKPGTHLINVARGKVVDEDALIAALQAKTIAAAALDVTREEPLPAASPLWAMPNVLITPHSAGETRRYEDAVIDILLDNLDRLERGETALRNGIV